MLAAYFLTVLKDWGAGQCITEFSRTGHVIRCITELYRTGQRSAVIRCITELYRTGQRSGVSLSSWGLDTGYYCIQIFSFFKSYAFPWSWLGSVLLGRGTSCAKFIRWVDFNFGHATPSAVLMFWHNSSVEKLCPRCCSCEARMVLNPLEIQTLFLRFSLFQFGELKLTKISTN